MEENTDYVVKTALKKLIPTTIASSMFIAASFLLISALTSVFCGKEGLATIILFVPISFIYSFLCDLIGKGGATLYSIRKGKGDADGANSIATSSMGLACITAFILSVLGIACSGLIVTLWGGTSATLAASLHAYAPYYFPVMFVELIVGVLIYFIRNDGNPKLVTYCIGLRLILILIFSVLFMGVMQSGIKGVAIACLLANVVELCVYCIYISSQKSTLSFRFCPKDIYELFASFWLSINSALESVYISLTAVFFNSFFLSRFGVGAVAVFGVATSTLNLLIGFTMGINNALQPLISVFRGEKNGKAVVRTLYWGLISGVCLAVGIVLLLELCPELVSTLYGLSNAGLQNDCNAAIRSVVLFLPIAVVNALIFNVYQIYGKTVLSGIITASKNILLILPVGLFMLSHFGMKGFYFSYVISEFATLVLWLSIVLYRSHGASLRKLLLLPDDEPVLKYHFLLTENPEMLENYRLMLSLFFKQNSIPEFQSEQAIRVFDLLSPLALSEKIKPGNYVSFYTTFDGSEVELRYRTSTDIYNAVQRNQKELLTIPNFFFDRILGFSTIRVRL